MVLTRVQRATRRKMISISVESGIELNDVAGMFGVSAGTVQKACRENNVKIWYHKSLNRNRKIVNKYMSGTSVRQLAEEYKLTRTRIRMVLGKMGIHLDITRRRLNKKRNDEIANKFTAGINVRQLAKEYKLTRACIYMILSDMGICFEKKWKEEIIADFQCGNYTLEQLAHKYGYTENGLRSRLQKLGYTIPMKQIKSSIAPEVANIIKEMVGDGHDISLADLSRRLQINTRILGTFLVNNDLYKPASFGSQRHKRRKSLGILKSWEHRKANRENRY